MAIPELCFNDTFDILNIVIVYQKDNFGRQELMNISSTV
jgi:hypothetical protein